MLRRPGLASIFSPYEGRVQEWITSFDDKRRRICVVIGRIRALLTSRRRKMLVLLITESNFTLAKSLYSYVQNHWFPMILIVIRGEITSSIINRTWIEGIARISKMKTGKDVQNISRTSLVKILRLNPLLVKVTQKTIVKKETMRKRIIIAWSWNSLICSITGPLLSNNMNLSHSIIKLCNSKSVEWVN